MKSFTKIRQRLQRLKTKDIFRKITGLLIHTHATPHKIAAGAALGVFLSVIPTFLIGMLLALFLAWKLRINLLATYLGTLVVNPFTASFFYYANYKAGSVILGYWFILPKNFSTATAKLYLGGIALGTVFAALTYGACYLAVSQRQVIKSWLKR